MFSNHLWLQRKMQECYVTDFLDCKPKYSCASLSISIICEEIILCHILYYYNVHEDDLVEYFTALCGPLCEYWKSKCWKGLKLSLSLFLSLSLSLSFFSLSSFLSISHWFCWLNSPGQRFLHPHVNWMSVMLGEFFFFLNKCTIFNWVDIGQIPFSICCKSPDCIHSC